MHQSTIELTLDEKLSKSSSLAIRRPDMARRANAADAGWNAAAYFSADRPIVAIIVEEKGAMVSFRGVYAGSVSIEYPVRFEKVMCSDRRCGVVG